MTRNIGSVKNISPGSATKIPKMIITNLSRSTFKKTPRKYRRTEMPTTLNHIGPVKFCGFPVISKTIQAKKIDKELNIKKITAPLVHGLLGGIGRRIIALRSIVLHSGPM
jgi:hypothetical protein